jgi:hypothetical protein
MKTILFEQLKRQGYSPMDFLKKIKTENIFTKHHLTPSMLLGALEVLQYFSIPKVRQ